MQEAVRHLLHQMNFTVKELKDHFDKTDFCGVSLHKVQPPRNPSLAPKHYVEQAIGKFIPHTEEEQKEIMKAYCMQYETSKVVCYCHYCLEGLDVGEVDGRHIASLLFENKEWNEKSCG